MADMPAYAADTQFADSGDEFAEALAGDTYSPARRAPGQGLVGLARNQLLGFADGGKADLVQSLSGIVGLVREIAAQVEGLGVEPLAGYARRASNLVEEVHGNIADKSVEALLDDGRALVRQQPEIAVATAMIIGFLGARLLKART